MRLRNTRFNRTESTRPVNYTYLITPNLLSNEIQRLDNPQPQLLPLLIFRDRNILNMPHQPQIMNEVALNDERACADDFGGAIGDAEEEVLVVAVRYPLVAFVPLLSTICQQ